MKDFDLEKALAGEPVVTRDGRKVTGLHLFEDVESDYYLFGVINGEVKSFKHNGEYSDFVGDEHERTDLFMAEPVKVWYANFYPIDGEMLSSRYQYDTLEKCKQGSNTKATHIIEYTYHPDTNELTTKTVHKY